jgi:hypothetical protein
VKNWGVFLAILFLSLNVFAEAKNYVNVRQYFIEALTHQKQPNFDIKTDSVRTDLVFNHFSSTEMTSFSEKAKSLSVVPGDQYQVVSLYFQSTKGEQYNCLGTVLKYPLNSTDPVMQQYKDRVGTVLYRSCKLISNTDVKNISGEFVYYQFFPLKTSMPISETDIVKEYELYSELEKTQPLLACQDRDTNLFGEPRSVAGIFEIQDYYIVRMVTLSSSADAPNAKADLPVNLGFIDKGSLDWVNENIDFLMQMKGSATVAFKKSDCFKYGDELGMPSLACVTKVPLSDRHFKVAQVQFSMSMKQVKSVRLGETSSQPATLVSSTERQFDITFVLHPENNNPPKVFKMVLDYQNTDGETPECLGK